MRASSDKNEPRNTGFLLQWGALGSNACLKGDGAVQVQLLSVFRELELVTSSNDDLMMMDDAG